jgi:hypothetical protein
MKNWAETGQGQRGSSQEESIYMAQPTFPADQPSAIPSAQDLEHLHTLTSPTEWTGQEITWQLPGTALLSVDQIYVNSQFRTSSATAQWDILKVSDMLNGEHLRTLSRADQHSALAMALQAAGVAVEVLLKDAVERLRVLNEYEQDQQSRFQKYEAVKLLESGRLAAELEMIRNQYQKRINAILEDLEQRKAAIREWHSTKEQEQHRITEAVSCISSASKFGGLSWLVRMLGRLKSRWAAVFSERNVPRQIQHQPSERHTHSPEVPSKPAPMDESSPTDPAVGRVSNRWKARPLG